MHFHIIQSSNDFISSQDEDVKVAAIVGISSVDNTTLLSVNNARDNLLTFAGAGLSQAQQNDPALQQIIQFLLHDYLSDD